MRFNRKTYKRLFDITLSLVLILIFLPVGLLIVLAIYVESPGPVLYTSKRVGTNYRIFSFLKFRSMKLNADKEVKLLQKNSQYSNKNKRTKRNQSPIHRLLPFGMRVSDQGIIQESLYRSEKTSDNEAAFFKLESDPRITKVGAFIRKTSLDELPQLINVLIGDMSIVGNRPLPLYEAEKLTKDHAIERFNGPAGITGLWQVTDRGKSNMSAASRIAKDIEYSRTYNLLLDIWILFKTPLAAIQKVNV